MIYKLKLIKQNVIFCSFFFFFFFFSSPEPSGSQGELIVYPYSGVRCRCRRCRRRRQQCLNIFSSETALPIKAKFYVEPPWEGGTKVYINGPGHMTKMAAMPIKPLKIFSRTRSPMILKLGMLHWGLKLYKVYINNDPGLTFPYFTARSNWVTYTFEWVKTVIKSFNGGKLAAKDYID